MLGKTGSFLFIVDTLIKMSFKAFSFCSSVYMRDPFNNGGMVVELKEFSLIRNLTVFQ